MTARPLDGVRVVDLTTFLSGPVCVRTLVELGADVIRVEPPQGDPTRAGAMRRVGDVPSDFYVALHRGRRAIVLDLKVDAARDVLRDLVRASDVLVENFSPGVSARLGLDDVAATSSRLVRCSITGFGADGPAAGAAATDGAVQAFGGVLELTRTGTDRFGAPLPVPIADLVAGATAAQGVLAALFERERTGRGGRVDVNMLEALLGWLLVADRERTLAPPTTLVVVASDGVVLLVQTVLHFHPRLLTLLADIPGCDVLATDPRFATRDSRVEHRDAYEQIVRAAFATRSSDEWLHALGAVGIPAARVQTIDEALAHPQLVHTGALLALAVPGVGARDVLAPPWRFDGDRSTTTTPAPMLGEHTDEVLRTVLGYDDATIARLRAAGAVGPAGVTAG